MALQFLPRPRNQPPRSRMCRNAAPAEHGAPRGKPKCAPFPLYPNQKSPSSLMGNARASPSASYTTSVRCTHPPTSASHKQSAALRARARVSTRRTTLTTARSATSPHLPLQRRANPGPDFTSPPSTDIDAIPSSDNDPPLPDPDASTTSSTRTWCPLCERYAGFMEEQWALDKLDEEHARVEAVQRAVNVRVDAEKRLNASENARRPTRRSAPSATCY
jgi:hypothetical protein